MTTIGIIGAGNIGSNVVRIAADSGYDVVISNRRGPDTLADVVDDLGPSARAATPQEAAEAGDLVVVTIPLHAYRTVPVRPLVGKVVIDTNNYYPQRDGRIPELDDESTTTAELLQAHLPGSHVVKAFGNIPAQLIPVLRRDHGDPERSVLAIAGDDASAKRTVAEFLDATGYDAYDVGPLAEGWRFQRDTAAYASLYTDPEEDYPGSGRRVTAEMLADALARAKRYRDM
jgi:predicted dinucleotide-binding enzyme